MSQPSPRPVDVPEPHAGSGVVRRGAAGRPVRAAGVVVLRPAETGDHSLEVLAVHRPRYDDWSLPKGKLESGEHALVAAVREVVEETGVRPLPGRRLPSVRYTDDDGRPKTVSWWCGTVGSTADREPDDEVDLVRWLPFDAAGRTLTHAMDADLLAGLAGVLDRETAGGVPDPPVVLLRHGSARSRRSWDGRELDRPLEDEGFEQARRLVPLLRALGPVRVVTSAATRCRQTVEPFRTAVDVDTDVTADLTEQAGDDDPRRPLAVLAAAVASRAAGLQVLCTHRPVLGGLLDAAAGRAWRTGGSKPLRTAEVAVLTGSYGSMTVDRHQP